VSGAPTLRADELVAMNLVAQGSALLGSSLTAARCLRHLSAMTGYTRTAIRRMSIRGFRSIRQLELSNIPDLVVLHGPNGAGKSNLLLAAELVLKAAALPGDLPVGRDRAVILPLGQADKSLGLRPDDFHFGVLPEIRIALEVELGTKAAEIVGPRDQPLGQLTLELIVQLASDSALRWWFERAEVGAISLGPVTDPSMMNARLQLDSARRRHAQYLATQANQEAALVGLESQPWSLHVEAERASLREQVQANLPGGRALADAVRALEAQFGSDGLFAERIRGTLLPRLVQVSPAYRVPRGAADPEADLFRAFISEDVLERDATRRLGRRLAKAGLFGPGVDAVALSPVNSTKYGEQQIRFTHPTHGELSLRNLGSGEQQVVYMLAQRVITPFPIAFLEEPEAHLHTSLMEPFARVLRESVTGDGGTPDVDQLWIATHHHHFALALEYFDVKLVDGATEVTPLPRAKAARHFYEPGPIWEALRQLASSAKERDAVVFRGAEGEPVTAAQILDSIERDPDQRLATEYARAMTEMMVLRMRKHAEGPQ
jgi:ABC-type transport system involved in cytochrome c biogenesis ATPase subunit